MNLMFRNFHSKIFAIKIIELYFDLIIRGVDVINQEIVPMIGISIASMKDGISRCELCKIADDLNLFVMLKTVYDK